MSSNLHAEDKGFQDWCQDNANAETINHLLYISYKSAENKMKEEPAANVTERDAVIAEGG